MSFEVVGVRVEDINDYKDTVTDILSWPEFDSELDNLSLVTVIVNEKSPIKTLNNISSLSDSETKFGGFSPVPENEFEDRLSKLNKIDTDSYVR